MSVDHEVQIARSEEPLETRNVIVREVGTGDSARVTFAELLSARPEDLYVIRKR